MLIRRKRKAHSAVTCEASSLAKIADHRELRRYQKSGSIDHSFIERTPCIDGVREIAVCEQSILR